MRHLLASIVAASVAVGVLIAGCAPAAPAPTQAPAAPAKAAEPAKPAEPAKAAAPAPAQPTAVPAAKVDFPTKGKNMTIIVPYPAGGAADVGIRVLGPVLEKELGVSLQILNKGGASSLVGLTELAASKPDGYTLAMVNQISASQTYMDPELNATYKRKDFLPLAMYGVLPNVVSVQAEGPYKTTKDLVDAAKASPGQIKFAAPGVASNATFMGYELGSLAGAKFGFVTFEGGAQTMTALLGGHTAAALINLGNALASYKGGKTRILGIADRQESKFIPEVKTFDSQGYKLFYVSSHGLTAPAGTPKPIMDVLASAVKKALENEDVAKRLEGAGIDPRFMGPEPYAAHWDEVEAQLVKGMSAVKQQ